MAFAIAADTQLLLVHGCGSASAGKDCNGSTWKNALAYYQDAGGRERESMSTIGYYEGDRPADCDVVVGDGEATNDRPIQDIAKDLAGYIDDAYSSKGKPVNIIAHSMGGLIARVALLGSAQDARRQAVESDGPGLGVHGAAARARERPRRPMGEGHRLEPRRLTRGRHG